jgi:hypothetical protein
MVKTTIFEISYQYQLIDVYALHKQVMSENIKEISQGAIEIISLILKVRY